MKTNFTILSKSALLAGLLLCLSLPKLTYGQCPSPFATVGPSQPAPVLPTDSAFWNPGGISGLNVRVELTNLNPSNNYLVTYFNSPGSYITVRNVSTSAVVAHGNNPLVFSVPSTMDVYIQNNVDGVSCADPAVNHPVSVKLGTICDDPVNITSSNITSFTADINWNTQEPGNAWEYLVIPQGNTPSGSGTAVTDSSASLTGLLGETDYDVYVRQECASGDTSDWAGPHTFSTLPCPSTNVTADLGNDTVVCEGDNFQVTIDAGNPGSTYLWSTNQTTQNITATQPGVFWVKVFDAQGCSDVDTIEIIEAAPPTPSLGSDQNVCLNEEINIPLDAGSFVSYTWSNGGQNQNETATEYGEFWVIVTDSNGCSGSDTIMIDSLEVPSVHVDDELICPGDSVLLLAPFGFVSYNWSTGSQGQSTMVGEEGRYTLIVTNDSGCADTTMPFVEVSDPGLNLGNDTTIGENDTLILSAPAGMNSYLWNTNASTQNIAVNESNAPGEFWVRVEDTNDCLHTDTIFVDISTGIKENRLMQSRIYPNPITEHATVELNLPAAADVHIQVLSLTGKVVVNERRSFTAGTTQHTLNLSEVSSGVYLVRITAGNKTFNKKITKL